MLRFAFALIVVLSFAVPSWAQCSNGQCSRPPVRPQAVRPAGEYNGYTAGQIGHMVGRINRRGDRQMIRRSRVQFRSRLGLFPWMD